MDTPSISTGIITVCTGLALLTPLVKALSQWHIALRKASKPDKTATALQSQSSTESQTSTIRVGRSVWLHLIFYVVLIGYLLYLSYPLRESRTATASDVAFIGLMVVVLLQNRFSRPQ
jgi:hypothetical protein